MNKYSYKIVFFFFSLILVFLVSFCGNNSSSGGALSAGGSTNDVATTPVPTESSLFTEQADSYAASDASEVLTPLGGGDTIDVGTGTDTIAYSAAGQTFKGVVTSGVTVLSGIDVISGMGLGDKVSFYAAATVSYSTSLSTELLPAPSLSDVIAMVRGTYDSSAGIFTAGGTATDTLLQWKTKGTSSTGEIENAVLKGYLANNPAIRSNNMIELR